MINRKKTDASRSNALCSTSTGGKAEKASGSTGPSVPGVNDGDPLGRRTLPDIYGLAVFRGVRMVCVDRSTRSTCVLL
jgi:hypothetical protein